jgi:hypothetical protein
MSHWADQHYKRYEGPTAVVRACTVPGCGFTVRRGKTTGGGRGNGMREGNKQRGEMIQHIKAAHPELKP